MTDKTTTVKSGGIGFVGLLTIVLIALRLIGVIEWAWIWVFMPAIVTTVFWIGYTFVVVVLFVIGAALAGD